MNVVTLLIGLVIFCVVAYILYLLVNWLVGVFGFPAPVGQVIMLILGLILFLMFLDTVGLTSTGYFNVRLR